MTIRRRNIDREGNEFLANTGLFRAACISNNPISVDLPLVGPTVLMGRKQ